MPVTIKTGALKYKNAQGGYTGFNAIAQETSEQQIADIQSVGATQVSAVQTKGSEVLASIPSDYTALSDDVSDLKSAFGISIFSALTGADFEQGSYSNTGAEETNAKVIRLRMFYPINKGDYIAFTPGTNANRIAYRVFTNPGSGQSQIDGSTWLATENSYNINHTGYIVIILSNSESANLSPSQYDASIQINRKTQDVYWSNNIPITGDYLVQKSIDVTTKEFVNNTKRLTTRFMYPVIDGHTRITIVHGTIVTKYFLVKYDLNCNVTSIVAGQSADLDMIADYNGFIRIVFGRSSEVPDLTISDFDANVNITNKNAWGTLNLVTANTDINSLVLPGTYICGRNDQFVNIPWSTGKRAIFVYKYSASYIMQIAVNSDEGGFATRIYHDGGWDAWIINTPEISNSLMTSNFIPTCSRRLMYTKGKIWEKNWNTAPAFIASGKDPNCWGISTDVRKTSDGYYVCFHDATLDAQTDGTGSIESKTWAEIQQINVLTGVWNGSAWVAQADGQTGKIPLLSDFLDICKQYGKVAIIETKTAGTDAVATLSSEDYENIMEMVYERGMLDGFAWITTNSGATYIRSHHPKCFKFIIQESTITDDYIATWASDPNLVFAAHNSVLTNSNTAKIHKTNHFVAGYTPRTNPVTDYEAMSAKGVDLIFTYREPPVDF